MERNPTRRIRLEDTRTKQQQAKTKALTKLRFIFHWKISREWLARQDEFEIIPSDIGDRIAKFFGTGFDLWTIFDWATWFGPGSRIAGWIR
jgi:hypothetical protein